MTASSEPLAFVVPGSLDTRTGGYGYDRRMIEELRAAGRAVTVHELPGSYPWPSDADRTQARVILAGLAEPVIVIDGLAFGVLADEIAASLASRVVIALVHHPLADEHGLAAADASRLRRAETRALALADGIITTSEATSQGLAAYTVTASRIDTVTPGTDEAPLATGSEGGAGRLLSVATLTPRKGHALLVEALAGLPTRDWHLHCVGSSTRDPATTRALEAEILARSLGNAVTLHGEVDESALEKHYCRADLFVLATHFEGYGMVFDEAIAHGLPIIASGAGAVATTVPADAGIVVDVDDAEAMQCALSRWFDEPELRARLREGARRHRQRLASWEAAGKRFATAIDRLAAGRGLRAGAST